MNEKETNVAQLLSGVSGVVKRYHDKWQDTGEKYNIFKVAGIAHREVNICRVLADLLNPQGLHCQGSVYLKLFWDTIVPKLPKDITLDSERAQVATEYVIRENRRIDIVLDDGKVFVPIEVKIWVGDQQNQLYDYFNYAKVKNKDTHVPALYLTRDAHEPSDISKNGIGENDYVCLSFKDDILAWLAACEANTKNTKAPIRETLKQLIAAIKSQCEITEDITMDNEIFKAVIKDDDTARAALAIRNAADFDSKAWEAFKGPITERLTKAWHEGAEHLEEGNWYYTWLPIKNGNYWLEINYLWDKICLVVASDATAVSEKEKAALYDKMSELFGLRPSPVTHSVWHSEVLSYHSIAKDELYQFHMCKLYIERPEEVVEKIVSIAKALEGVKA